MPPKFINPYNFVRYDPDISRLAKQRAAAINGHNSFAGYSGRLHCNLITLSHLFVGDSSARNQFYKINKAGQIPGIPGSTIKGVIRSVAEAIASSCFSISAIKSGLLPLTYLGEHCKLAGNSGLCIACRLFGSSTSDKRTKSFGGKVAISDAPIFGFSKDGIVQEFDFNGQNNLYKRLFRNNFALMGPNLRHHNFYVKNGAIRGRKFYYHGSKFLYLTKQEKEKEIARAQEEGKREPQFKLYDLIEPNTVFQFSVDFCNLTEIELGLLCLSLQLEWDHDTGIAHKIGQGKPIGLGSSRIEIHKIEGLASAERRYTVRTYTNNVSGREAVNEVINPWIEALKNERDKPHYYEEAWNDLSNILAYPSPYADSIEYPGQAWFDDASNTYIELPDAYQVSTGNDMLEKNP